MVEYEQSPVWQGELRESADTSGLGWVPSPERPAVRDLRNVVAAAAESPEEDWWPPSPARVGPRLAVEAGGKASRWDQEPLQAEYQGAGSRLAGSALGSAGAASSSVGLPCVEARPALPAAGPAAREVQIHF